MDALVDFLQIFLFFVPYIHCLLRGNPESVGGWCRQGASNVGSNLFILYSPSPPILYTNI